MSGYNVETVTVRIGNDDYRLRRLIDRQQFHDPDGHAERAGISSATWPMFGMIWPVGLALADEMSRVEIGGRRILEVGCGLALSTLVLARRDADVTASDHHPLAEEFLRHNLALNALPAVPYHHAPWEAEDTALGRFDLIVGSDVLYEPNHAMLLAGFIARHAAPRSQLLIADAGRGYRGQFARRLAAQGFSLTELPCRIDGVDAESRGRILKFERSAAIADGS